MSPISPKKILKISKVLWGSAVSFFVIYFLFKNHVNFLNYLSKISLESFCVAVICAISAKIVLAHQMAISVSPFSNDMKLKKSIYIYSLCDVSKYIPGGIWAVTLRSFFYNRLGLNFKQSLRSLFLEYFWLLGGGLLMGLISIIIFCTLQLKYFFFHGVKINLLLWSPFLILFILISWVFFTQLAHRILLKKLQSAKFMLFLLIRQCLIWPLFAVSIYVLVPATTLTHLDLLLLAIGSLSLGKIAGILVIISPGGIGVREGAIALILSYFIPLNTGVFIAICNRIILFSTDILLGLFSLIFLREAKLLEGDYDKLHPMQKQG